MTDSQTPTPQMIFLPRERTCDAVINMASPSRSERVRDFQPPWRTVYVYVCPECGAEHRMRASSYRGSSPTPSVGGIVCGAQHPLSDSDAAPMLQLWAALTGVQKPAQKPTEASEADDFTRWMIDNEVPAWLDAHYPPTDA